MEPLNDGRGRALLDATSRNARHHDMRPVLGLPRPQALAQLRPLLTRALADKQSFDFSGEETVMKYIGG